MTGASWMPLLGWFFLGMVSLAAFMVLTFLGEPWAWLFFPGTTFAQAALLTAGRLW